MVRTGSGPRSRRTATPGWRRSRPSSGTSATPEAGRDEPLGGPVVLAVHRDPGPETGGGTRVQDGVQAGAGPFAAHPRLPGQIGEVQHAPGRQRMPLRQHRPVRVVEQVHQPQPGLLRRTRPDHHRQVGPAVQHLRQRVGRVGRTEVEPHAGGDPRGRRPPPGPPAPRRRWRSTGPSGFRSARSAGRPGPRRPPPAGVRSPPRARPAAVRRRSAARPARPAPAGPYRPAAPAPPPVGSRPTGCSRAPWRRRSPSRWSRPSGGPGDAVRPACGPA